MRLYIDESGDVGLRLDRAGTSPFFVLAGVVVDSDDEDERCRGGLEVFVRRGNFRRSEFKFSKCDRALRLEYLRAAAELPWRHIVVVLDKSLIVRQGIADGVLGFEHAVTLLLQQCEPFLRGATLVFDRCGNRQFPRTLERIIRSRTAPGIYRQMIRRVLARTSHSDPMLQLADMVAGATARSFAETRNDAQDYRTIILKKELRIRIWPP